MANELITKLQDLKTLPPELHWFCTACKFTDSAVHDLVKTEHPIGQDVYLRREHISECLTIFAFDDEAFKLRDDLGRGLDKQLGRCDVCIVEYYKSRQRLLEKLRHDYDEDNVNELNRRLDDRDIERIRHGLDDATRKLRATDPTLREKNVLEPYEQLALFEALCCRAFLENKTEFEQHFQEPFTLVQTIKKLRILHFVPAATMFLFDPDHGRSAWATQTWLKYRETPTKEEFDFAIRDPLFVTMQSVFVDYVTDLDSLQRVWRGIGLIVRKLNNDLVTHSLRAMEIDVFKLALEHLKYDTPSLRPLMQTIEELLDIAPRDFWDSMGAISPTTFIEQIFNNAQYDRFIEGAKEGEDYNSSALNDMLSWIRPFMASLETAHQAQACRSLAFQLLDRLQAERFPVYARTECYRVGLATLSWTLNNCNKEATTLTPVGRAVAAETLEVASKYIKDVLNIPSLPADNGLRVSCADFSLRIVKYSLALECKWLRTDQEALKGRRGFSNGHSSYAPAIWDAVVQHMDRGNLPVARAALIGINDLTGLEKFKVNGDDETYTKEKSGFNVKFGRLTHLVCQILERINDFDPIDLDKLFRHSETATALVASLFSPDPSLYEAGVNLIKSISSESARKEAIGHLLGTFFETTLNAFSWSVRRIALNRTFASCPRMLKTSSDVLDILCNSQTGLLRTRQLSGLQETTAIENFWEHQWEGLRVIYEMTEDWGRAKVADSDVMKDFCRDTMQFSERFFDQYSIFANAINSSISIKTEDGNGALHKDNPDKKLLQHPASILAAMVKWLRLRDLFLVDTSVKLTKKVLDRLTELGMTVAEDPCNFLQQVIGNSPQGRTHLKPQEKAELARALEANLGHPIAGPEPDAVRSATTSDGSREQSRDPRMKNTKTGTIDLEAWKAKADGSRKIIELPDDDEFGDGEILDQELSSVSRSVELMKRMKEQQPSRLQAKPAPKTHDRKSPGSLPIRSSAIVKIGVQSDADRALFREKREKEREAKKKRDAETLAMVKKKAGGTYGQTPGEGSGLGGIGVKGKDHAPKGPSMMVSSGSESESDDLDEELFGRAPKPLKKSTAVLEFQASRQAQARAGPVKKTRQVRSAKDMRARLAPDLTALHKTMLGWDFFHNGDFPPGSARDDYSLVTSKFRTPIDYQNTFEPLLILEAWQAFLKSKEEGNFKTFEIKVANRMTVDAFLELSTTMPMMEAKELGIGEADVILISKGQSPAGDEKQPHCLARLLKVSRKKATMEITYRVNVGNRLVASMVPNSTLFGVKVSSITPLEREYGALLGLKYFDLCDEITKARPSPLLAYSEKQLSPLVANYSINPAQAKAVKSAIDNDAFTLIQGPPGSGKTKTIVAIVGALLTGCFVDKGVPVARPQTNNGSAQRSGNGVALKKLLVCAPSNAAVDELVMRFKQGVKTTNGENQQLSVVRLGRSDAINANVRDVTLEELVNAKLHLAVGKKTESGDDIHTIMGAHKTTCDQLNAVRAHMDELKAKGQSPSSDQTHEFELLKRKKQQLSNQIDIARDSGDTVARDAEINRRRIQQDILDGAHVICATLSGSGHEMFQGLNIEFETVVIDEAAQSIELSALIPLKYGCSKCILVGDPKQLPPTVLSRDAARFQYEQSLFVRMQVNHPEDVHLLDTQYRMHPEISLFPSDAFYDGRLLDGPGMGKLRTRPWHESDVLGPYRFFDVQGVHQSAPRGHSLINLAEVDIALKLFDRLITDWRGYDFRGRVGIITPYKSQLRELRSRFAQKYGDSIFSTIEFNTTDAFQGRESEVIIFSCVRASVNRGIGFLSDIRRMNVGITRAKSSLWVLGNSQSLMQAEFWGRLIHDAKSRNRYTSGDLNGLLKTPRLGIGSKTTHIANGTGTANADTDIEMPNAPIVRKSPNPNRRESGPAASPIDRRMTNDVELTSYQPAGGFNGLNENHTCLICGCFAHSTNQCDNMVAKENSLGRCHRCGAVGHVKNFCKAEICLTCGAIGHLQETCTGLPLSRKEKERLFKSEAERRLAQQRAPEFRRRKQMGDHDNKVPIIRTTSRTPPPRDDSKKKRKREPSAPVDAPTGPKIPNGPLRSSQPVPPRAPAHSYQPSSKSPNSVPNSRQNGLPARPPSSTSSNMTSSFSRPNNLAADPEAKKAGTTDDRSRISLNGARGTLRDPRFLTRPTGEPSDIVKLGQVPEGLPTPRGPLAPQNLMRPLKKRKEVDPFIRPKKRR